MPKSAKQPKPKPKLKLKAPPPPKTDDPANDKAEMKDGVLQPLPASD